MRSRGLGRADAVSATRRAAREIAEAHQPLALLPRRRHGRLEVGAAARQRRAHRARHLRLLRQDVPAFSRVAREVVELRPRAVDQVVARVRERAQLAPAEVDPRVVGLAVDRRRPSAAGREQIPAACRGRRGDAERRGERGHDVAQARGRGFLRPAPLGAGQLHEQRNVQRLAIQQDPMLLLAVVEEALAVVRGQHDERVVVAPEAAQARRAGRPRPRRPRRSRPRSSRRSGRARPGEASRACAARRGGRTGRTAGPRRRAATRAPVPPSRGRRAEPRRRPWRLGPSPPRRRNRNRRRARWPGAGRRRRPRPRSRSRARAARVASVSCFGSSL